MIRVKLILLLLVTHCLCVSGQEASDDFGMWYTVGVKKTLSEKVSVLLEGEYRTRNKSRTSDRWSGAAEVSYKPHPLLKVEGGYKLIDDNQSEKISYTKEGTLHHWRPSYWRLRHRVYAGLELGKKFNRLSIAWRERWQYTYHGTSLVERYDFEDERWEEHRTDSKAKHELRSRLKVEYDFPHWKLDPEFSVEFFNTTRTDKIRMTLGTEYKIQKKHVLAAFYRFQFNNEPGSGADYNEHIIGLGYEFHF